MQTTDLQTEINKASTASDPRDEALAIVDAIGKYGLDETSAIRLIQLKENLADCNVKAMIGVEAWVKTPQEIRDAMLAMADRLLIANGAYNNLLNSFFRLKEKKNGATS